MQKEYMVRFLRRAQAAKPESDRFQVRFKPKGRLYKSRPKIIYAGCLVRCFR